MKGRLSLWSFIGLLLLLYILPVNVHAMTGEDEKINIKTEDFLYTDGIHIKNKKGDIVQLRGCNLGGWLHLEGWMDGGCNHVDYDVRTKLISRFGEDKADELLDSYQNADITEEDFAYLSSMGVNFVRIPFYWMEILTIDGKLKDNAFAQLDDAAAWGTKYGIYILLDLHGSPGGHTSGWLTGGQIGSNELWSSSTYQAWTVKLWTAIAEHYKGNPAIAAYGLLNEPLQDDPWYGHNKIQDMYTTLYKAIREVDPDHIISMGSYYKLVDSDADLNGYRIQNFNDIASMGKPEGHGWNNVIYETHHYFPGEVDADINVKIKQDAKLQSAFANQQLKIIRTFQLAYNVPVLASEFNFWLVEDAWDIWLNGLNYYGVSWTNWTYKTTVTDTSLSWGLYHNPSGIQFVDFDQDSAYNIAKKWSTYTTKQYRSNKFLEELFKKYSDGSFTSVYYIKGEPIDRKEWIIDAYKESSASEKAANMIDGDLTTYWSSGDVQNSSKSQLIELDMAKRYPINKITMYTENENAAKGYEIYLSEDAKKWNLIATGEAQTGKTAVTFEAQYAQHIRIVQTGEEHNRVWMIHELNVIAASDKDIKIKENDQIEVFIENDNNTHKGMEATDHDNKKEGEIDINKVKINLPYYICFIIGTVLVLGFSGAAIMRYKNKKKK
ncbi:aryl-phospho-beta-D-glucosidase BglC (GH1 family) [Anaerotaenia torta]|uniref:cellulase family glycosylhydrolase n=1 Tax=Anaerotaenia torta TaxID=433293 RepID=UPI003D24DEB1